MPVIAMSYAIYTTAPNVCSAVPSIGKCTWLFTAENESKESSDAEVENVSIQRKRVYTRVPFFRMLLSS